MQRLNPKNFTCTDFVLQRAQESYIAAAYGPNVFLRVQHEFYSPQCPWKWREAAQQSYRRVF